MPANQNDCSNKNHLTGSPTKDKTHIIQCRLCKSQSLRSFRNHYNCVSTLKLIHHHGHQIGKMMVCDTDHTQGIQLSDHTQGIQLSDHTKGIQQSDHTQGIQLSEHTQGIQLSDHTWGIQLSDHTWGIQLSDYTWGMQLSDHN